MRKSPNWMRKLLVAGILMSGAPLVAHQPAYSDEGSVVVDSPRKYLTDYQAPFYEVPETNLHFNIEAELTTVTARLRVVPVNVGEPLVLDGSNQTLISVKLDGTDIDDYDLTDESLTLYDVPSEPFWLEIVSTNKPHENSSCSGLYKSGPVWVSQCESEGFRRITYFPDRPDVLSRYTVTVEADKESCPYLLSNGNLLVQSDQGSRHVAVFHDPFPKPSYLFALVAGDFGTRVDSFTTRSGREVAIECYVTKGLEDRLDTAVATVVNSLRWDEKHFNREYDSDSLRLVGVTQFNAGAMENKTLLVFNEKYLVGDTEISTDHVLNYLQHCVCHEYFHNWSGNRVSPRDWFQLTLKEGLTTYREQEFMADFGSALAERINDVRVLRGYQFPEDAGPNAHPIQPQSYEEIWNFYTVTIYEKGAEFYRMLATRLGEKRFHDAVSYYFDRQDGKPTTLTDFVDRIEEHTGEDLSQMRYWITQAGTPELTVSMDYNKKAKRATLKVKQYTRPTPESPDKQPFEIPLLVALYSDSGKELVGETLLRVTDEEQSFVFEDVSSHPVPSLNRGFSAPVKVFYPYSDDDLEALLKGDSDQFNRWEAVQQLMGMELERLVAAHKEGAKLSAKKSFVKLIGHIIGDKKLSNGAKAQMLCLPSVSSQLDAHEKWDIDAVLAARSTLLDAIAEAHSKDLRKLYSNLHEESNVRSSSKKVLAQRSLKNVCLAYLVRDGQAKYAVEQFKDARNMTDQVSALGALLRDGQEDWALNAFAEQWADHEASELVMLYWLGLIGRADRADVFELVEQALASDVFDPRDPNKAGSLLRAFTQNTRWFHEPSGKGYKLIADQVIALAPINAGTAAHLVRAFSCLNRLDAARGALMRGELERIIAVEGMPVGVLELAKNTLQVE